MVVVSRLVVLVADGLTKSNIPIIVRNNPLNRRLSIMNLKHTSLLCVTPFIDVFEVPEAGFEGVFGICRILICRFKMAFFEKKRGATLKHGLQSGHAVVTLLILSGSLLVVSCQVISCGFLRLPCHHIAEELLKSGRVFLDILGVSGENLG